MTLKPQHWVASPGRFSPGYVHTVYCCLGPGMVLERVDCWIIILSPKPPAVWRNRNVCPINRLSMVTETLHVDCFAKLIWLLFYFKDL